MDKKQNPSILNNSWLGQCEIVARFAPSLLPIAATFAPFSDVLLLCHAGPQPGPKGKGISQVAHEHFTIVFPASLANPDCEASYTVSVDPDGELPYLTSLELHLRGEEKNGADDLYESMGPQQPSVIWNHLRQLPRPISSFTR